MKVLMLSIDKKIFEEGSDVRNRMLEYGELFDELHIVVYTKKGFDDLKLSENVFLYPTNTVFKFFYFFDAYFLCKKIIKKCFIEVITSQDALTNFVAIMLKYKFKNIKLQVQLHTDFLSKRFKKESFKNFFRYIGYVKGVRSADCIRVVSESMKNKLMQQFGINNSKISVLPIFVDIEKIKNTPITSNLHKKYPQFEKIILIASRLEGEKNIPIAISKMKDVVDKYPKTGLVIVGDGSEVKGLKSKVSNLKLKDSVIFESWQNKDTLMSYYKTADLFLVTSDYEGYGITIIEALVAGLPVLSTDVGIAREAGAKITDRDSITENIVEMIEDGPKTAELTGYPYKNKAEYLDKFKQSFSCAS